MAVPLSTVYGASYMVASMVLKSTIRPSRMSMLNIFVINISFAKTYDTN